MFLAKSVGSYINIANNYGHTCTVATSKLLKIAMEDIAATQGTEVIAANDLNGSQLALASSENGLPNTEWLFTPEDIKIGSFIQESTF